MPSWRDPTPRDRASSRSILTGPPDRNDRRGRWLRALVTVAAGVTIGYLAGEFRLQTYLRKVQTFQTKSAAEMSKEIETLNGQIKALRDQASSSNSKSARQVAELQRKLEACQAQAVPPTITYTRTPKRTATPRISPQE